MKYRLFRKIFKCLIILLVLSPFVLTSLIIIVPIVIYFKDPQYMNERALINPLAAIIKYSLDTTIPKPDSHKKLHGYKIADKMFYLPKGFWVSYSDKLCESKKNAGDKPICYEFPESLSFYLTRDEEGANRGNSLDVKIVSSKIKLEQNEFFKNFIDSYLSYRIIEGPEIHRNFTFYKIDFNSLGYKNFYFSKDQNSYNSFILCGYTTDDEDISWCESYKILSPYVYFSYRFPYEDLDEYERLGKYVEEFLIDLQDKDD